MMLNNLSDLNYSLTNFFFSSAVPQMTNKESEDITVICLTGYHESHKPEYILNNDRNEYWLSTGLYPQILVIDFKDVTQVESVSVTSEGIKDIAIKHAIQDNAASSWTELSTVKFDNDTKRRYESQVILESNEGLKMRYLRLIMSGYGEKISIKNLNIKYK